MRHHRLHDVKRAKKERYKLHS